MRRAIRELTIDTRDQAKEERPALSSVGNRQKELLFTEKMKVFLRRNPASTLVRTIAEESFTQAVTIPNRDQEAESSSKSSNILAHLMFSEQMKAFMEDQGTPEET